MWQFFLLMLILSNLCFAKNNFTFQEKEGIITVTVNGESWSQLKPKGAVVKESSWLDDQTLDLIISNSNGHQATVQWKISWPELHVQITSSENASVAYPWPFVRKQKDEGEGLLLPVAEGILYPSHNQSIKPYDWLKGYAGYGLSLPLFGVVGEKGTGYGFFAETPDYFQLKLSWEEQWLLTPFWENGEEKFGKRTCRFLFLQEKNQEEGVVTISKWYRSYLKEKGYLTALGNKNPKQARFQDLIACPQIWVWSDPVKVADFLQLLGIKKALLANVDPKYWTVDRETINKIHNLGYLTGRYDNYEDRWPPSLSNVTEWTKGWPEGLVVSQDGSFIPAWKITDLDGEKRQGAKLCSGYGKKIIRRDLPKELKKWPWKSRFIDTLPATELRSCYAKAHPHDREKDRKDRMAILKFSSQEVLTGTEKGCWWSIGVCHYHMGILSLNPYPPVADVGENPSKIVREVSEDYLRFNVGPQYRVPLFELVAHDCVLPTWYWGDGQNKHPDTWRDKDLFTVLYGGVQMFCFSSLEEMTNYATPLKKSYEFVQPALQAIGASEMTSFRNLSPDKNIQQTQFTNGIVVTVNFSKQDKKVTIGKETVLLPSKSYYLTTPFGSSLHL